MPTPRRHPHVSIRDHCWPNLTNLPLYRWPMTSSQRNSRQGQYWATTKLVTMSRISNLSFVTLNVHVILQEVIDLTDVNVHTALGTSVQELTGDWEGYQIRNRRTAVSEPTGIAPTQELGRALFATGVEGFRAISAEVIPQDADRFYGQPSERQQLSDFHRAPHLVPSDIKFLEN